MYTKLSIGALVALVIAIGWAVYVAQQRDAQTPEDSNPVATPGVYRSEHIGVEFHYTDQYQIEEGHGGEGGPNHVITLINKADLPVGQNTEGPRAITIGEFVNDKNLPLDEWVRTTPASNWQLSNQGELGASTVGDEPGLGYTYSGLYEETVIAVARGQKVYLFSVGTLTANDQIKTDFFTLLDTVQFI